MNVIVLPTPDALATYAAGYVAEEIRRYETGRVNLGLAGGSTPKAMYQHLADADLEWDRIDVWLSDERWVPEDHEDSNAKLARTHLDAPAAFHFPTYDSEDHPHAAAAAHSDQLRTLIGDSPGPHIVLLGIGDDAHTASLFPGTDALEHDGEAYVANWVESKQVWRLTATIPLLHAADHLIFLVSGSEKAAALAAILEGDEPLPAKSVADGAKKVTWLIDEAAAMHLKTTKLTRLFA